MMDAGFKLPDSAMVDKFIAKSKFYERAALSSKMQNEFIRKIQKITWKYKLAQDTVGISKTDSVTEIQIFQIELKERDIPKNILKVVDAAIPYPILYQFVYKDEMAYGVTLKGMAGKKSAAARNYYFSAWNQRPDFDFTGIDLEKVCQKIIKAFVHNEARSRGDFAAIIDADNQIRRLEKEIAALRGKIKREKQFNRKVELNKSLLERQKRLQVYKGK
ncbi:conserved hypothetical protein [Candidatus Desulfarcum epimagneticum]|uniref:DUF4391 domain-containing protein n=1 Tax=uncultured Desulfobacteraceae bacterium TaxID=218296 RepID=A0A484HKD1_9BACT|nr:conserved hypothetical protein [uncultured Desulfobacteraceae bacterium]